MDRDHTPGEIALTGFLMLFAAFAAYGSAYKTFEGWEKGNFMSTKLINERRQHRSEKGNFISFSKDSITN